MASEFQVSGHNAVAPFTLKLHRDSPCDELEDRKATTGLRRLRHRVQGTKWRQVLRFEEPSRFPRCQRSGRSEHDVNHALADPEIPLGAFSPQCRALRVRPAFMNDNEELSYGEAQEVAVERRRETYPGLLNVTFTRGFVSSQAFVDRYASDGPISKLLPAKAADGLKFFPTHPKANEALKWMGFEAFNAILEVLDKAIADNNAQCPRGGL